MATLSLADIREKRTVQVQVDRYGVLGEGVVELTDGVLLIPGAMPGERLTVRLEEEQGASADRLFAKIIELHHASPERRDPLCPKVDICGGCQLRHLTIAEELRFKVETVREAITQYGEVREEEQPEIEIITSQPIARGDAFRIRAELRYRRRGQEFELGLSSGRGPMLIAMDDCPALVKSAQRLVSTVQTSLEGLSALPPDEEMVEAGAGSLGVVNIHVAAPTYGVGLIDVELTAITDEAILDEELTSGVIGDWLRLLSESVTEHVGLSVRAGDARRFIKEPRRISIPIDRWEMRVGPEDWFHSTLEPAEVVYEHLMRWLELQDRDDFLDVGCGTGTISLMASEHARRVVGIDINRASIENAELNGIYHDRDNIRFVLGGWERGLRRLVLEGARFSVATINPDGEPLGRRALVLLQALGVERLVYLGPSPEAAARDIGELGDLGFELERLGAANLHPATAHTLLMAKLRRRG